MNQYFPPFQGQKLVQIEVLTVKTEVCEILLIKAGKIFKKGKKTTWVGEGCSDFFNYHSQGQWYLGDSAFTKQGEQC